MALTTRTGLLGAAVLLVAVLVGFGLGRVTGGSSLGGEVVTLPAPATSAPADPAGLGDDDGLDAYAVRCHDGEMDACEDLYYLSDAMSDYEHYGLTCGGRVKPFEVAACTDLG